MWMFAYEHKENDRFSDFKNSRMCCFSRAWLSDHAGFVSEFEKIGIKTYKPYLGEVDINKPIKLGNFNIKPFPLEHDVPNYGFYITHPDIGKLVYITDTKYCKYRFKGINALMVEANYSKEYIYDTYDERLRDRVINTHMEIGTTLDFIKTNDNPMLKNIVLIHLSDKNGNPVEFQQRAEEVTDKEVYIARKGLEVDLDLIPF